MGCESNHECSDDKQCFNGECISSCLLNDPCAVNAECYGTNHRAACRCASGFEGNPLHRCERIECVQNSDCPLSRSCVNRHCVDPCAQSSQICAQNAICTVRDHHAACRCPESHPLGDPTSYCQRRPIFQDKPECEIDPDCPSRMACIRQTCQDPCTELHPCTSSSRCSVLDTVPVRTMVCECPDGWVPEINGECRPIPLPSPPGCTSDADCPDSEACINRQCHNPCDCGLHATCFVRNHRPICSCEEGMEGNPNIACRTVGCRVDSECSSSRACVNGQCIDPCLLREPCGINAECFVRHGHAECRCLSGYRGNSYERCVPVGCRSNNECPMDRQCIDGQCIDACLYDNPCSSRAECRVQNHQPVCRCPNGWIGNPYIRCRLEPQPECLIDTDCGATLACLDGTCKDPCEVLEPCRRPAECHVVPSAPVRTMYCECPNGYISSGEGTCKAVPAIVTTTDGCVSDTDCPTDKACVRGYCRDPCNCALNAECRVRDHRPVCSCKQGFEGNPELHCVRSGCRSDQDCSGKHRCSDRRCVPVCPACGIGADCYAIDHRPICECPAGLSGDPQNSCILVGCRSDSDCPSERACVNDKCVDPCANNGPCSSGEECEVRYHKAQCLCAPGFRQISDGICQRERDESCIVDGDCASRLACIGGDCINPCNVTAPCGVNTMCTVLDTLPVRTMICECLPGYQGNAAVQCDKSKYKRKLLHI